MIRPGQTIALCVIALLCIGTVMVNSAGLSVSTVSAESPTIAPLSPMAVLFSRSALYMGLAVLALGFAAFLPVRRMAAWAEGTPTAYVASTQRETKFDGLGGLFIGCLVLVLICALAYVPGLAREVNGSHRWVRFPGIGDALSFQPSEIAKWGLVVMIAWYCTRRAQTLHLFAKGLLPALCAVGLVAGFIVVEDLGTGVLIAAVAAVVLLAGGAKFWHFAILSPAPIAGVVLAILTSEYRVARIMAFVNPYKDAEGIGYHTIQSLLAVAGGEGFGRGLGFGVAKFGYLPEDKTDFVFAVICEELGIAGAAVVVTLFAGLVWSGLAIMRREESRLLRLIVLGVIATVGVQACINIAVVTAMAPTKGIALPLISSGGTGWVLTAFSLGVAIAVDRTQRRAIESGSGVYATPIRSAA